MRKKTQPKGELITVDGSKESQTYQMAEYFAQLVAEKTEQIKSKPRKTITFKDFAHLYICDYAFPHKKTWLWDKKRLERYVIPIFGERLVHTINAEDIVSFHAQMARTPCLANRLVEVLSKMFRLAQQWGYWPEHRKIPTEKCVKAFREDSRDRFVNREEMQRLGAAINRLQSMDARCAFWLYILTALRKNELLSLRWDDIDFASSELRVGVTKNGLPHHLPISPEAMALFNQLEKRGEFVFPGRNPGESRTTLNKSWDRVRKEARLTDIRLHDLRRTAGAWLAKAGTPVLLIGRVLNHKTVDSTMVYARFANDDVREAVNRLGKELNSFIGVDIDSVDRSTRDSVPVNSFEETTDEVASPMASQQTAVPKNAAVQIRGADQIVVEAKILIALRQGGSTKKAFYRKIGGCFRINASELDRILNEMIQRQLIESYSEEESWNVVRYRISPQ